MLPKTLLGSRSIGEPKSILFKTPFDGYTVSFLEKNAELEVLNIDGVGE